MAFASRGLSVTLYDINETAVARVARGDHAQIVDQCTPYLSDDHLIVLRSTVHPGGTRLVERALRRRGSPRTSPSALSTSLKGTP